MRPVFDLYEIIGRLAEGGEGGRCHMKARDLYWGYTPFTFGVFVRELREMGETVLPRSSFCPPIRVRWFGKGSPCATNLALWQKAEKGET